jgi:hypothetical protein
VKKKRKPRKKKLPGMSREGMVKALEKTAYFRDLFDTAAKREFRTPLFGFVVPLLLTVVDDLGTEEAFEFVFSNHFKAMCVAALVQINRKEQAKDEVARLAKDMNLKLPKDKHDE